MMKGIQFVKVWSDEDVVELQVEVSDGSSSFVNQVYVGHGMFADTVSSLDTFKDHLYGGLLEVRFGDFGPEYANGAFHARFHFPEPGRLYITARQESEFEEFGQKTVATCATMYIKSEPVLLDRFIGEMRDLASGRSDRAFLEAV